jgi:RHS repeat-associated protein
LRQRFTGKERDAETGLDYFGERYFISAQGRWTNPDRPLMDQHAIDPQSWNLYTYVRNNPLRYIDPTGLCAQGADGRMHDDDDGKCVVDSSVTVTAALEKVQTVRITPDPDSIRVSLFARMTGLALNTQIKEAAIIGATTYVGAALDAAIGAGINALARTSEKLWGPAFGTGPLPAEIANTFRSGTYTELVTTGETTLYRAYGGESRQLGSYWTRTPVAGPLQTRMDSALPLGNTAESVVSITVPAGTRIFEGAAAPNFGHLGGGSQVFIPRVDPTWVK